MTTTALREGRHRAATGPHAPKPLQHVGLPAAGASLLHYLAVSLSAAALILVLLLAVATVLVPAAVGGRPLTVLTQSMEPTLPPGTLVIVRPEAAADIRLGDVLTYQLVSGEPAVVSHRVVGKTVSTDGSTTFVTRGDNNDVADEKPVQEVQIVGTVWYSVPLLGWVNTAVNGEARGVIVPVAVALLFGYAGWTVLSTVLERRRRRRERPVTLPV
ncbi:signal peptidase I [Herbiconiux moechotypicola]|uniref:Signal peptidase I n=1 Tax=Herbiconiux moechotypicola TaxID=637393 RepID=A0ABN3DNE9_9MICO|nr:signal peptidase I [Herbiconiux moechotypicola]MCS5730389.1 signal peptidase I [Herbiconiux moechotypicola]